ncbi:MAG: hypothetical protein M1308_17225 [Actinobacteria bacterium]|nr:hypothetical protein [Actinomycetota bacterium]
MSLEIFMDMEEYKRCAGLLTELIGLDVDTEERIYKSFESMGIKAFFCSLNCLICSKRFMRS